MNCVIQISGTIVNGDLERLRAARDAFVRQEQVDPIDPDWPFQIIAPEGMEPFTVNEKFYTICLDSPGGSLSEALRMAEFIRGRMGTAVARNASCLSSCAVLFMAGTGYHADENAEIEPNRHLHAAAILGFHAPSLELGAGQYSEAAVEKSFAVAISSLAWLMENAEKMLMSQQLVLEMISHVGDDFYYVDTVDKVVEWRIAVEGTLWPAALSDETLADVCIIGRLTRDGRVPRDISFSQSAGAVSGQVRAFFGPDDHRACGFSIEHPRNVEISGGLKIYPDAFVASAYADGYRSPRLGTFSDYPACSDCSAGETPLYPYMLFRERRLARLARAEDGKLEFAETAPYFDAPIAGGAITGVCAVADAGGGKEAETCVRAESLTVSRDLSSELTSTFIWPSGSKTIVTGRAATPIDQHEPVSINGAGLRWPADDELRAFTEAQCKVRLQSANCSLWYCPQNAATGNMFCFAEPY